LGFSVYDYARLERKNVMNEHIHKLNERIITQLGVIPLQRLSSTKENTFWLTVENPLNSKQYTFEYEMNEKTKFAIIEWRSKKVLFDLELKSIRNPLSLNQILKIRDSI